MFDVFEIGPSTDHSQYSPHAQDAVPKSYQQASEDNDLKGLVHYATVVEEVETTSTNGYLHAEFIQTWLDFTRSTPFRYAPAIDPVSDVNHQSKVSFRQKKEAKWC